MMPVGIEIRELAQDRAAESFEALREIGGDGVLERHPSSIGEGLTVSAAVQLCGKDDSLPSVGHSSPRQRVSAAA